MKRYKQVILLVSSMYINLAYYTPVYANGFEVQYSKIARVIGFGIILFMGLKDMIADIQRGDIKSVVSTALKYAIAYAVILAFPTLLNKAGDMMMDILRSW